MYTNSILIGQILTNVLYCIALTEHETLILDHFQIFRMYKSIEFRKAINARQSVSHANSQSLNP